MGENGDALYTLTQDRCQCVRVANALTRIHQEYTQPLTVEVLIGDFKMSVSAFHRAFKQTTGDSPLQYIKKIRLNQAKELIVHKQVQVGDLSSRL